MVVLAEYNTITEAEIAKSMLDSAGIWSMIRNEWGIDKFREFFTGYEGNYVIIGGTACEMHEEIYAQTPWYFGRMRWAQLFFGGDKKLGGYNNI